MFHYKAIQNHCLNICTKIKKMKLNNHRNMALESMHSVRNEGHISPRHSKIFIFNILNNLSGSMTWRPKKQIWKLSLKKRNCSLYVRKTVFLSSKQMEFKRFQISLNSQHSTHFFFCCNQLLHVKGYLKGWYDCEFEKKC